MAIGKAMEFVKQASIDKELRSKCNKSESKAELMKSMDFTEIEFDDAINMRLVKCQTYEQAEIYQQLKLWFLQL